MAWLARVQEDEALSLDGFPYAAGRRYTGGGDGPGEEKEWGNRGLEFSMNDLSQWSDGESMEAADNPVTNR